MLRKINDDRKFNKLHCNVNKNEVDSKRETCYTDEFIIQLRDAYNANVDFDSDSKNKNKTTSRKYTSDNREKITSNVTKDIIHALKENLACSDEKCWLQELNLQQFEQDKIICNFFLPHRPDTWMTNEKKWVSNEDIERFMQAIQYSHKTYKFITFLEIC